MPLTRVMALPYLADADTPLRGMLTSGASGAAQAPSIRLRPSTPSLVAARLRTIKPAAATRSPVLTKYKKELRAQAKRLSVLLF